ncbi:MAG: permease-like cell division protein FtsX [Candidatus Cyclonatronum sp.]|uniref:cell division protein FtsX n=1 Tax=Cyclonatronum sp. TaxID=3024185 RepID=UPI0025C4A76A|nr:permease-like cell division protein FtsX [Cyclonatronum sp.]MCC5933851.1 ABC transporter permease [Balneolales bacterium]MCH8486639.1 permease-like cell division protein FtsX [Cyclonatronum sp.]
MSFSYVMREGLAGFRRARLSAFSSVLAITLAVVLVGVLTRVSTNAFELAQAIKQEVEVEVFLADLSDRRMDEMGAEIRSKAVVETAVFISREAAMDRFRQEFGAESELFGEVLFLPASFLIRVRPEAGASEIVSLVEELRQLRGVEEVRFNQRGLELLEERLAVFVAAGSFFGLFISFVAFILVFNTIRLTIYAKRDLIKAMKLVGATNGFIKRPFMVEGSLQGFIGGLIGAGFVWLIFAFGLPAWLPQLDALSWPLGEWYWLSGTLVVLGILLGFAGSRSASKKFIQQTKIS